MINSDTFAVADATPDADGNSAKNAAPDTASIPQTNAIPNPDAAPTLRSSQLATTDIASIAKVTKKAALITNITVADSQTVSTHQPSVKAPVAAEPTAADSGPVSYENATSTTEPEALSRETAYELYTSIFEERIRKNNYDMAYDSDIRTYIILKILKSKNLPPKLSREKLINQNFELESLLRFLLEMLDHGLEIPMAVLEKLAKQDTVKTKRFDRFIHACILAGKDITGLIAKFHTRLNLLEIAIKMYDSGLTIPSVLLGMLSPEEINKLNNDKVRNANIRDAELRQQNLLFNELPPSRKRMREVMKEDDDDGSSQADARLGEGIVTK